MTSTQDIRPVTVLGLISGTSHDGIDAAVAEFAVLGADVLMTPQGQRTYPFPDPVDDLIRAVLPPNATTAGAICQLDTMLGRAFAGVASDAMAELSTAPVDLISSHGQTVFHWEVGGRALGTLQLGQPAYVAEMTGVPVVSDIRARDIAAGGHGAPLASTLDVMLLGGQTEDVVAMLNLGGIANMTVVGGATGPFAYDLGPANALIDAAVTLFSGGAEPFDVDGRNAAAGNTDPALLKELLADPYYSLPAPKSTGKELFNISYLRSFLSRHPTLAPRDAIATLTAHAAEVVATELEAQKVTQVIASGGGVHNPVLMAEIDTRTGPSIGLRVIDELGVPADSKEAFAVALIGFLTSVGAPGVIPSCTGSTHATVLGSVTPGRPPLSFPSFGTLAKTPDRLVVNTKES